MNIYEPHLILPYILWVSQQDMTHKTMSDEDLVHEHRFQRQHIPDGHPAWKYGMAVDQHQILEKIGWKSRSYGFLSRMGYTWKMSNGDVNWTIKIMNFWWVPLNFSDILNAATILVAFLVNYHVPFTHCSFEGTQVYHISRRTYMGRGWILFGKVSPYNPTTIYILDIND